MSVGGCLVVDEALVDQLDAFAKLETVGGSLVFNTRVTNLHLFSNLSFIGGDVVIRDNELLGALSDPTRSVAIGGNLFIANNEILPTCEAESFEEGLRTNGFTGQATICGNQADACGSTRCMDATEKTMNTIW